MKLSDFISRAPKLREGIDRYEDPETGDWSDDDGNHGNTKTGKSYHMGKLVDDGRRSSRKPARAAGKFYHDVPYVKKDAAKEEGMRFDGDRKKWYHTSAEASDASAFKKLAESALAEATETRAESLAKKIPAGIKGGDNILDAAYEIMVKDVGKKQANYYFRYDEDFPSEVVTAYLDAHKVSEASILKQAAKKIGRAASGWGMFDKMSPAQVRAKVAAMTDAELISLAKSTREEPAGKGSPQELQANLIKREILLRWPGGSKSDIMESVEALEKLAPDDLKAELEAYTEAELMILADTIMHKNVSKEKQLAHVLHAVKVALNKRFGLLVKEDWGSSDWYPVMKNMAENIHAGMPLLDAAYEAGSFHKEHMGYPDTAQGDKDMQAAVARKWIHLSDERKKFFTDLAAETHEKMQKLYAAAKTKKGKDSATNEAVTTKINDMLNIDAVREHRTEFLNLLNQWKAIIAKEHSSYMRRGSGGKSDWYSTRSAFKTKMDSISSEFQKLFAKHPNSKKYDAIDTFDFTYSTPFQFWKQLTAVEEGPPRSSKPASLDEAWKVIVRNKDGVEKRFPANKVKSAEADEWRNSSKKPAAKEQGDRTSSKAAKEELDRELHLRITNAIGASFPDGEPLDRVESFLRKNDLDIKDVDRVMKRFEKNTYNGYLADMWDDYAADSVSDAKAELARGHVPQETPFFRVEGASGSKFTGKEKIVKNSNPWK